MSRTSQPRRYIARMKRVAPAVHLKAVHRSAIEVCYFDQTWCVGYIVSQENVNRIFSTFLK